MKNKKNANQLYTIDEDFKELSPKSYKYKILEPIIVIIFILFGFTSIYKIVFTSKHAIINTFVNEVFNTVIKNIDKLSIKEIPNFNEFNAITTIKTTSNQEDNNKEYEIIANHKNNNATISLQNNNTNLLKLYIKNNNNTLYLSEEKLYQTPINLNIDFSNIDFNYNITNEIKNNLVILRDIVNEEMIYPQSKKDNKTLVINDKEIKVKELKLVYTEEDVDTIVNNILSKISKNKDIVNFINKITFLDTDTIQSYLNKKISLNKSLNLYIYTTGLMEDFIGFKIEVNNKEFLTYTNHELETLTISAPENNLYKIEQNNETTTIKKNDNNIFTIQNSNNQNDILNYSFNLSNYFIKLNLKKDDQNTYTFNGSISNQTNDTIIINSIISNAVSNIDELNIDKSINFSDLTQEEIDNILEKTMNIIKNNKKSSK